MSALILLAALAAVSLPVAQIYQWPPTRGDSALKKSRLFLFAFGRCMVRQDPRLAREFLLAQGKNYILDEKYVSLAKARCLSATYIRHFKNPYGLRLSQGAVRYVIAEALVARDLRSFDPSGITLAAPLSHAVLDPDLFSKSRYPQFDDKVLEAAKSRANTEIALSHAGECAVRAEPVGAQRLLKSEISSKEESRILSAMLSAFTRCMDKDQKLTTDPLVLRGTIAANYYRLAHAPRVSSSGVIH